MESGITHYTIKENVVELEYTNDEFYGMEAEFNSKLPGSLTMSQYELAVGSEYTSKQWSEFLRDGQVSKWIEQEVSLVTKANQYKLISSAADNERSVGAAQMLNAMSKMETADKAEANFFIYSFVPLTANEQQSEYTRVEPEWQPPLVVDTPEQLSEETKEFVEKTKDIKIPETVEQPEEKEVADGDWLF